METPSQESDHGIAGDLIRAAYRQGAGRWVGCDWPTAAGVNGLDLNGIRAFQAALMAGATGGAERDDWLAAANWLAKVELTARLAEEDAMAAVHLATTGDLAEARARARRACHREAAYHDTLVWQALLDAVEAAA